MDADSKKQLLEILNKELGKQQGIFNRHAPKAINPTSIGYEAAFFAFNEADRKVKDLQKMLAYIITEDTYEPTILDQIKESADKITKGEY
ncbi:MAG: hypothetical protein RTU63_12150 [Candidatus Thorarchaeota archaeon]